MAKRNILDYQNNILGELELPDGTSEEEWQKRLSPYLVAPPSPQDIANARLRYSIKDRKIWADEMLERFKERNISLGINAPQSLWLHHRMRALEVNFAGVNYVEDILNMAVSGDIETACISLLYCQVDDMTLPHHWFSTAARDWLVAEMKGYLGWP